MADRPAASAEPNATRLRLSTKHQHRPLVAICVLAAAKTAFLCLAYPIFTITDEHAHYDTIARWARGDRSMRATPISDETLELVWRRAAFEYVYPAHVLAPLKAALDEKRRTAPPAEEFRTLNCERAQPPLYYAYASTVYALADALHAPLFARPFIIRLLNVPILVLTILATHRLTRLLAPGRPQVALAAAALVALIPQDACCQIGNDTLSAATCGWALVWLIPIALGERVTPRIVPAGGLAAGLAILTKWSNVPILLVVGLAARRLLHPAGQRRDWTAAAAVLALAIVPPILWSLRCRAQIGDLTGTAETVRLLCWQPKPVSEWLSHPFFAWPGWSRLGSAGWGYFLLKTCATYCRGEMAWYGEQLHSAIADIVYLVLTLVCLIRVVFPLRHPERMRGRALLISFGLLSLLQLVYLSLHFDFGPCVYPSAARPYMVSGRLILGTLPAFAVLMTIGLDELLPARRRSVLLPAATAVLLVIFVWDAAVSWPAFGGPGAAL